MHSCLVSLLSVLKDGLNLIDETHFTLATCAAKTYVKVKPLEERRVTDTHFPSRHFIYHIFLVHGNRKKNTFRQKEA